MGARQTGRLKIASCGTVIDQSSKAKWVDSANMGRSLSDELCLTVFPAENPGRIPGQTSPLLQAYLHANYY
jgi:hypothetical protein